MHYTMVVLDATRIQPYIFSSNTLSDIVGASHLVEQSTNAWPEELLGEMGISDPRAPIEDAADVKAELIYAGGGNAMLLFRDSGEDLARQFASLYSRKLLA